MDNYNDAFVSFPQANDFEKVVVLANIKSEDDVKDSKKLKEVLNVSTERTIAYYISACQYLGIIGQDKSFTEYGKYLRELDYNAQVTELCRLIIADPTMGAIYFGQIFSGHVVSTKEAVDIMKRFIVFEGEAMYKRRSQCARSWVNWVINKINSK